MRHNFLKVTFVYEINLKILFKISAVGQSLLCGGFNKVILDPDGKTSSISMALLNTDDKISSTPCSLKIYVPDVYALSITFAYVVVSFTFLCIYLFVVL